MKLKRVHIKNYRSCKDVPIEIGSMQALVGANNAKLTKRHSGIAMLNCRYGLRLFSTNCLTLKKRTKN
jgi:hypothetical protein